MTSMYFKGLHPSPLQVPLLRASFFRKKTKNISDSVPLVVTSTSLNSMFLP